MQHVKMFFGAMVGAALVFAPLVANAGTYEDYFFALNQDNSTVVGQLIERGFDPNTPNPQGQHGLLLALRLRSEKVARVLASVPQTEVNVLNEQGESALMLAALRGYLDICITLIDKDADVNKPGWTPLHYAASGGHNSIIRLLLDRHAYIDAESPNGTTPLMMAAMYGTHTAVKYLLDSGADVAAKNSLGLSALDFAKNGAKPESVGIIAAHLRKQNTGGSW